MVNTRKVVIKLNSQYKMKLNYKKINNLEVDGIDLSDYPDFCDAFITSADYGNRPMTEKELEILNEDYDFVYDAVQNHLH